MAHSISVRVTAPFAIGDVVARLSFDGAPDVTVVLRDGAFKGDFEQPATRILLTTEPAPAGEAPLAPQDTERAGTPEGTLVFTHDLFEHGVDIPAGGELIVKVGWGTPCHEEELPPKLPEGTRFNSFEHMLTAALIGKDSKGNPLEFNGKKAAFTGETDFPVAADKMLKFGDIIALAGDFYAFYDERAKKEIADAWPEMKGFFGWIGGDYRDTTLSGDSKEAVAEIMRVVFRDRDAARGAAGEFAQVAFDSFFGHFPARRYLALASQNYCHFASQPSDGTTNDATNDALRLYRAYHQRAIAAAKAAGRSSQPREGLFESLVVDAFGCHFLTDSFASGHMRTPRRVLGERHGILKGALQMSHEMHSEDNRLGLWVTPRGARPGMPRIVWRAFGDGMLRTDEAKHHLGQVREAVRRSVAEVFEAFCGAPPSGKEPVEASLPVPLAAGLGPVTGDLLPNGDAATGAPNHYPLYTMFPGGKLGHRKGDEHKNEYEVEGANQTMRLP